MMDLIDRQAAIKALEETKQSDPFDRYEYQNIGIDWSIDAIMALPSAQPGEDIRAMCGECDAWNQYKNYPQPGWIPCSETEEAPEYEVIACDAYGEEMLGYLSTDGVDWECDSAYELMTDVVAWMKKPKPWKEDGHEAD